MHLRIGFDDPFPPFAWLADGHPTGSLIERVAGIVAASGCTAEFVPLALERSEAALLAGEVDVLAFKAVVPERRTVLAFSSPIESTGAALFAPMGSPLAAHGDIARCAGLRIATPARGPLTALIGRLCPQAVVVPTEGYEESLQAVLAGDAHAAALNVHVGAHWAGSRFPGRFAAPGDVFAQLDLAMAAARGRGEPVLARLGMLAE